MSILEIDLRSFIVLVNKIVATSHNHNPILYRNSFARLETITVSHTFNDNQFWESNIGALFLIARCVEEMNE